MSALTDLVSRREPYLPPDTERPDYEHLANVGLANRTLVGPVVGYLVSETGLSEFRAWVAQAERFVQFR